MADKEYIERAALIGILDAKADLAVGTPKEVFASVRKMVELLPTADAVEVLRCKDCKYSIPLSKEMLRCKFHTVEYFTGTSFLDVLPTSFCSFGERKDECE